MGAEQDAQPGAIVNGVNRTGWAKPFAGFDGSNLIQDYAWFNETSGHLEGSGSTHPIGTKRPNELGIYDISGNVIELVWDWFEQDRPSGTLVDHRGPATGEHRMIFGGGWGNPAPVLGLQARNWFSQEIAHFGVGIRLVRTCQ
jgi:sulfatase modifying factor 1